MTAKSRIGNRAGSTGSRRGWSADIVRERIRVGSIVGRLQKHVMGELEMSPTQIRAAEILLKKTVPDLSQVEHTGEITNRHVSDLTDAEIVERLERIRAAAGAADEAPSPDGPAPIH